MSNQSEKYINNSIAFGANKGLIKPSNVPSQYASRQTQYMGERTAFFNKNRAYLATDYVKAKVQGLDSSNFYNYISTNIRLADILTLSASSTKKADDYKNVLFPELSIEYIPIGAKIETMGNIWLVINPSNMSNAVTTTVIARCNASYNTYDDFGNVINEPILVEKYSMLGNDNETPNNLVLMDGYFNITCQLNAVTQNLKQNSRIILGKKAYHVTGLTDFIQEFSGDRNSCHLLTFTVRVEEPTKNDDIETNFIADGNLFSFNAYIQATNQIQVGESISLIPHFMKGYGDTTTEIKNATWQFYTSNENIAIVTLTGTVIGMSAGKVIIGAICDQNDTIGVSVELVVNEELNEPYIAFVGVVPQKLTQYDSTIISASYFMNNIETSDEINWTFKGASQGDYSYLVDDDTKSCLIRCDSPSDIPLTITISCKGKSLSTELILEGY